jgi:hypothetical protein
MAKKIVEVESKTEKLRALRLAHEAARKEAGTWGEMQVGEVAHEATKSVFVQVWKGANRPDPFRQRATRHVGVPAGEWLAITSWVNARRAIGFSQSVVAWDVSTEEARKIAKARIAERLSDGYTVMNPEGEAQ